MTLQRDLQQFRAVQQVYMPCVAGLLSSRAGQRTGDIETETVYLPSALSLGMRESGCASGLISMEEAMQESQCFVALDEIRAIQRAARQLATFSKANVRGTLQSGRSFDAQKRLAALTKKAANKYHASRHAIFNIRGPGPWENTLRVLNEQTDIRSFASDIFSTDLTEALVNGEDGGAGSKYADLKRKRTSHGFKTADTVFASSDYFLSWIWRMVSAFDAADKDEMDGLIRVEWMKSWARCERSREHIVMLKDSRERTLLSLEYEAKEWLGRRDGWSGASPELAEGIAAYCHFQANGRHRLADKFTRLWATKAFHGHPRIADRIDLEEEADSDSDEEEDILVDGGSTRRLADLPRPRPGMRDQVPEVL